MKNICVIGTGYVGLVTGTCFADLGNNVTCIDIDEPKISKLQQGTMPIYEPGLEEVVRRNAAQNRLRFTTSYEEGIRDSDFIFICVDTPSGAEGEADLYYVREVARGIAEVLDHSVVIVNRSTVPIGTGDTVADVVRRHLKDPVDFAVVSNPEFTREGSAVSDFLEPDRVVLGATDTDAAEAVAQLYLPLRAPIIVTDLRTAEMIKYASNAFLATRLSFINEIASICEQLGADIKEVAAGMGYDQRIGHNYLDAGIGWGGSCFPKDVKALAHMAAIHGTHPQLLRAVIEINRDRRRQVIRKLRNILGRLDGTTIGVLGLSFKPNTDDMREAPSVEIIHMLQHEGAQIKAYDPVSMDNANRHLERVTLCEDPYDMAASSDALVITTEWNEFKQLDLTRIRDLMRRPVIIDGRNIYEPDKMVELGFIYQGMGRGYNGTGRTEWTQETRLDIEEATLEHT
ncbi:MAG: UDP-glucose 6-dehydrogenase TuaD [Anaerolineales bacterium]|nr:UDP-glucose 6-dehydrogenase TuaD [Anaerolineales bacterium]